MFLKTHKRLLAVVATVAICFTMATPMTAKAIDSGNSGVCTHEITLLGIASKVLETRTHSFCYYDDINDDGYEELLWEECTVEVIRYFEADICLYCGHPNEISGGNSWIEENHSAIDNTQHTYDE